jgi:O-antigen/teichoic acid export membrane protein
MLLYSFPLALSHIAGALLSIADRYALKFLVGFESVGIYSLGFKIANTTKVFLISSVQLALPPLIFKMINQPNNKRFYSKIMTYLTFGVMFLVLAISLFGIEIVKVVARDRAYWDAYTIIPIISFALVFEMLKNVATNGLTIVKKTKIIAVILTIMSLLNVILNLILISFFDVIGAAVAGLLTQIIFFIMMYQYAQKYYFIPYEISKIVKMVAVALLFVSLLPLVNQLSLVIRLMTKCVFIIIYPVILYYWNLFEQIEIVRLKEIWITWRNPAKWKENFSKK